jgi:multisubunit Na+/H+ antiporter MnhE subunit
MRVLAEIAAWWMLTFAAWLASVPAITASELLIGGISSLCCSVAAPWVRRANDGSWKPQRTWIRWLPMMLWQLPGDTWQVWRRALMRSTNDGRWVRLDFPEESQHVSATRRAIALLALGATPATVVVESDPEENALVIHRLTDKEGPLESAVKH